MKRGLKKAQVGIEYMIIVGFVTLAIMSVLALAMIYSDKIKDRIRLNQVENFASQLINSAESVYFSGEPSKTTIWLYLPDGISELEILPNSIVITTHTSSGNNKREFDSKVPLSGELSTRSGIRKIILEAQESFLSIRE